MNSKSITEPEFHARPVMVPTMAMLGLSCTAILAAIVCFCLAGLFWLNGKGSDKPAALALASISCLLLAPGISGLRIAAKQKNQKDFSIGSMAPKSHPLLRVAAFLAALLTLFAGILSIWEAIFLYNQDYLQWFKTNHRHVYDDNWTAMWQSVIVGELFIVIALFLSWFALFKGSCRSTLLTQYQTLQEEETLAKKEMLNDKS